MKINMRILGLALLLTVVLAFVAGAYTMPNWSDEMRPMRFLNWVYPKGGLLLKTSTPVNAVNATGLITISGRVPIADETFVIGTRTFTWKASRASAGQVAIGAGGTEGENIIASGLNLATAVGLDLTNVTATDHQDGTVTITAATAGTVGNMIFTESCTHMTMNGSGKLGGTTAGVDGTVGRQWEIRGDASYLYWCVADNTTAGKNWRRVSVGTAY